MRRRQMFAAMREHELRESEAEVEEAEPPRVSREPEKRRGWPKGKKRK